MKNTLLCVIDTHPVQYRAPLYRELEKLLPGGSMVIYGSDYSVRGYRDAGFGHTFAWDVPLLEGYSYEVLGSGSPYGWNVSWAAFRRLRALRPRAILLTDIHGRLFWAAYLAALTLGCALVLRTETQDEAYARARFKSFLRYCYYRVAYLPMTGFFFIGELNRRHYLRHGVRESLLVRSPYATVDGPGRMTAVEKVEARARVRAQLGIGPNDYVVAFFGKLVAKKNPDLILDALQHLVSQSRARVKVLYVGSGMLESTLRDKAAAQGVHIVMAGFVNQSGLPGYYLASDMMVLPSRRMGETWGLVVNEALQAGCAVAVTNAVGCAGEFSQLARVSVIEVGDAPALAHAIRQEMERPRDFEWAITAMRDYSVECAAHGIVNGLRRMLRGSLHE